LGSQDISGVQGNEGDNAQKKKNRKKRIVQKNMAVFLHSCSCVHDLHGQSEPAPTSAP